uniref:Uncharacterized protein si:ch73-306e8.2 isoform X1 n=1 Tax=Danio rerio TaxID=7955 RepID=A0A8M3B2A5_DANRE|nr:uncharacterized protein si:ch73-306e8.2 isoform X4 [Danio rerio]XP_017207286.1 uncharacterized protein si:ch73-306e8.2 isoform X2 [Danio rerio]|eukprot:XP_009291260.1 uncharacterized protein si:ch73-306e8.2 isoform X4 [Danio rerio]
MSLHNMLRVMMLLTAISCCNAKSIRVSHTIHSRDIYEVPGIEYMSDSELRPKSKINFMSDSEQQSSNINFMSDSEQQSSSINFMSESEHSGSGDVSSSEKEDVSEISDSDGVLENNQVTANYDPNGSTNNDYIPQDYGQFYHDDNNGQNDSDGSGAEPQEENQ